MPKKSSTTSIYGQMPTDDIYSSISTRLAALIESQLGGHDRKFAELEKRTRISRNSWIQWHRRCDIAEPSARLIQAAALEWPQHAFWLVTGYEDPFAGHVQPDGVCKKIQVHNRAPKNDRKIQINRIVQLTNAYFKSSIEAVRLSQIKERDATHVVDIQTTLQRLDMLCKERSIFMQAELVTLVQELEL